MLNPTALLCNVLVEVHGTFIPLEGTPAALFLSIIANIPSASSRGNLITLPLDLATCVFLGSVV